MMCKNKEIKIINGMIYNAKENSVLVNQTLYCLCTNDENGKSLSIDNGTIQFTIPFDIVAQCFEGDYRKH